MLGISLAWRIVIFFIGWGLGFLCLLKTLQVGNAVGPLDWAENRLGPGGTYSAVKITGVFLIIVSLFLLVQG